MFSTLRGAGRVSAPRLGERTTPGLGTLTYAPLKGPASDEDHAVALFRRVDKAVSAAAGLPVSPAASAVPVAHIAAPARNRLVVATGGDAKQRAAERPASLRDTRLPLQRPLPLMRNKIAFASGAPSLPASPTIASAAARPAARTPPRPLRAAIVQSAAQAATVEAAANAEHPSNKGRFKATEYSVKSMSGEEELVDALYQASKGKHAVLGNAVDFLHRHGAK